MYRHTALVLYLENFKHNRTLNQSKSVSKSKKHLNQQFKNSLAVETEIDSCSLYFCCVPLQ